MLEPALGIIALLLAHNGDRLPTEPPEASDDRAVFAEQPVSSQGRELVNEATHIIGEMRPGGMARNQRFLPRRQFGIGVADKLVGPGLQPSNFAIDVYGRVLLRELAQLHDLALELGDGAFEFEISMHQALVYCRTKGRLVSESGYAPLPCQQMSPLSQTQGLKRI